MLGGRWWLRCVFIAAAACNTHAREMYCSPENCYDIMGVKRTDDAQTIKKAFRQLSKQWHPDKHSGSEESHAKFLAIGKAHDTLSDSSLREAYDYYLDHPEEHMYNQMRYYKAVYQPKTPLWIVLLCVGILFSGFQYYHMNERAKAFLGSPMLEKALEEEYIANCSRGLWGWQTGEMTDEKKAEVKEAYFQRLSEDPDCPLCKHWTYTLLPSLLYRWPVNGIKAAHWRIVNHARLQREKAEAAEAARKAEEEARREREEKERIEREKAEKKAKNAAYLAQRQREEDEKRQRWAEEAEQEEEERQEKEAAKKAAKAAAGEQEGIVTGKVVSADEMRKKGHFLIEVEYDGDERVQIVVTKPVSVGQVATVALEGATLEDGKTARRSKIAGEWSEGVLIKLGGGKKPAAKKAESSSESESDEEEDEKPAPKKKQQVKAEEEDMPVADAKEGKAKQRKGKKKG